MQFSCFSITFKSWRISKQQSDLMGASSNVPCQSMNINMSSSITWYSSTEHTASFNFLCSWWSFSSKNGVFLNDISQQFVVGFKGYNIGISFVKHNFHVSFPRSFVQHPTQRPLLKTVFLYISSICCLW